MEANVYPCIQQILGAPSAEGRGVRSGSPPFLAAGDWRHSLLNSIGRAALRSLVRGQAEPLRR